MRLPPNPRLARLFVIAAALLLLAGLAAFFRGWLHSDMYAKIPWDPAGAHRAVMLSIAYWAAWIAIVAGTRRALGLKVLSVALVAVAAVAGVLPVLFTVFLFLSACALGHGILSRNGRSELRVLDLPLCTALGLGILAAVLVPMALIDINTPFTYFVLLALPLPWHGARVARVLRPGLVSTQDIRWRDVLLLGAVGNFALLALTMAVLPEVGNDALAFHLLIAAHVNDFGYWHFDVQRNVLAVMPLGVTMLYAAGYMFAGEMAARLINVGALFAILTLVYATVRPLGNRSVALLATLLAAASPLAFVESSSLLIDNVWSLLVVGSLVAFLQFAKGGENVHMFAGALALGASLAAKSISIAAFPGVALLLLLALKDRGPRFPWRTFALAVAVGLALALPAYVIAFAKTGNPVFPFFNALFQSPFYPDRNFQIFPPSLDPLLLYRMTFYSDEYLEALPGSFGFTFLLLGPAVLASALAWGRREGVSMAFAALAFAVVVCANIAYLRYLYPAAFLFAIAFGATLAAMPPRHALLRGMLVTIALGSVVANLLFLPAGWAPGRKFELAPIVDASARHDYITRWAARRHVVPVLNALPDQQSGVAFLGGPPFVAQLRRPAYIDSAYMRTFLNRVSELRTPEDLLALVREFDLGYLLLDSRRERDLRGIVESVASPLVVFSDSTLYRVQSRARYTVEQLKGERLAIAEGAWIEIGDVPQDAASGVAIVNDDVALYQRVPIVGGRQYRYAVEARCHEKPADVRLQVIWHWPNGHTQVSSRSAACMKDWAEEEAVFPAPVGAVAAVVFAIGHGKENVAVRNVSFRAQPQ